MTSFHIPENSIFLSLKLTAIKSLTVNEKPMFLFHSAFKPLSTTPLKQLWLLCLLPFVCVGQTHYDQYETFMSRATKLHDKGEYEQAITNYTAAFEYIMPRSGQPYFKVAAA